MQNRGQRFFHRVRPKGMGTKKVGTCEFFSYPPFRPCLLSQAQQNAEGHGEVDLKRIGQGLNPSGTIQLSEKWGGGGSGGGGWGGGGTKGRVSDHDQTALLFGPIKS